MRYIKEVKVYDHQLNPPVLDDEGNMIEVPPSPPELINQYLVEFNSGRFPGRTDLLNQGYMEYSGREPLNQLKCVDGKIVPKTAQEIEIERKEAADKAEADFYAILAQNTDLVERLSSYKQLLDHYGLPYDATIAQMVQVATDLKLPVEQMLELERQLNTLNKNIIVNLQWCNRHLGTAIQDAELMAWEDMPAMIAHLVK